MGILKEQANSQLKKWNYLFESDENKKDLLHKSFAIFNGSGTRVANQFIVEVDIKNKRFLVFSSKICHYSTNNLQLRSYHGKNIYS